MTWRAIALGCTLLLTTCSRTPARVPDRCVHGNGDWAPLSPGPRSIETVFVILMENKNWAQIFGSASAPYLNGQMLPRASWANRYSNAGLHPSEPNYLWLEGGTTYGIRDNDDPSAHHLPNRDHFVSLLDGAGIPWRAYQEGIDGRECPLQSHDLYAAKHNPFVFFDDVTGGMDPRSERCIEHMRPLPELESDLEGGAVARYNFITPDLCNDMHNDKGCASQDMIRNGDAWLSEWIPRIERSAAYRDGGAIFLVWDESAEGDHPFGMIVLSPAAKGGGYSNEIPYTHSSLLRTLQEIFGVGPLLCDAANAEDLRDLFRTFP
jgi:hypothetical protein